MWSWSTATGFDWNTVKPAWLLLRELERTGDLDVRDELLAREGDGRLAGGDRQRLIAAALAAHADPNAVWDAAWHSFVQGLGSDGLTDEQMVELAASMMRQQVRTRERLPQGVHLPILIGMTAHRPVNLQGIRHGTSIDGIIVDGQEVGDPTLARIPYRKDLSHFSLHSGSGTITTPRAVELPVGEHQITIRLRQSLHKDSGQGPTLGGWLEEFHLNLLIEPPEIDLIREVRSDELDQQVREAITLVGAQLTRSETRDMLMVELSLKSLPVDVAFQAYVRDETGRERRLHTLTATRSQESPGHVHERRQHFGPIMFQTPLQGRAELILRSSVEAALQSIDLEEIWGGELVFEIPEEGEASGEARSP